MEIVWKLAVVTLSVGAGWALATGQWGGVAFLGTLAVVMSFPQELAAVQRKAGR